jgi:MerR family transcriptional regulator/heat shock protein HspR
MAYRFLPIQPSGGSGICMAEALILYSIGEAADLLGVSVPTLRMYEREGLILPLRKASRHRLFSEADLERIRCLRETINEKKVSIAGIKRLLALIPCWKIKNCPPHERNACPALLNDETPCWTVATKSCKCSSTECRLCPVYMDVASCDELKKTIVFSTIAEEPCA